jgi:hypothetical protein
MSRVALVDSGVRLIGRRRGRRRFSHAPERCEYSHRRNRCSPPPRCRRAPSPRYILPILREKAAVGRGVFDDELETPEELVGPASAPMMARHCSNNSPGALRTRSVTELNPSRVSWPEALCRRGRPLSIFQDGVGLLVVQADFGRGRRIRACKLELASADRNLVRGDSALPIGQIFYDRTMGTAGLDPLLKPIEPPL